MEFDHWVVLFLRRCTPAPDLSEAEGNRVQDAHLAHLSKLHDEGALLAAGPVDRAPGSDLAGICILPGPESSARARLADDPAVRAGFFRVETVSWSVPAGTIRFLAARWPRSMADAARE